MAGSTHHQVLIIGGGTAGITVAAILKRQAPSADVAIVEPAQDHYYQPAFTLVGAGIYPLARTQRAEQSLIPFGVRWIRARAQSFQPEKNTVGLENGDALTYDYLVVCTGVKLDWGKITGLAETLGKNGVCSNYSPAHATYTWDCIQRLRPGSRAVFTQPPLPFKCPGAPQKIAYLAADHLRREGILKDCSLHFYTHAPTIFGVPFFARELVKVAARYGIEVHYQQNLVAVDGAAKTATFESVGEQTKGQRNTVPFDLLHVSPPQSAPEEIKSSPLANPAGWVEVNQNSMQHVRYPNVFSLGDVSSTPNSKTAAAVRKQAPVVVRNILKMMGKAPVEGGYDGYASCPLTTAFGKTILAEFIYGGKVTPTLPLNPAKEHWVAWWIKVTGLPMMYWHYMLKGHVWFPRHNTAFKGDAA
ncbi:MAG TPA: FAD/NAD(P)-binding oxidoreductase [Xanthobacteraceae bacterium]|jgi:sulfide:quinone oxidoreductase